MAKKIALKKKVVNPSKRKSLKRSPVAASKGEPPKVMVNVIRLVLALMVVWLGYEFWSYLKPGASAQTQTAPAVAGVTTPMSVVLNFDGIKSQSGYVGWSSDNSWNPNVNKSIYRTPFSINGKKYDHGIGTHAPSQIVFALNGRVKRFSCLAGADDSGGASDNVIFSVLADGKTIFTSSAMRNNMEPASVDVDVTGVKVLSLNVDYAPGDNGWGHADWLNVKFAK